MRDTDLIPKVGAAILCAKVVLVPLVFDPSSLVVFAAPKSLVAHGLGVILFALLIGHVVTSGRQVIGWTRLHTAAAAFGAVATASTFFALNPIDALYGAHDRRLGLATIADNVIVFTGITTFLRRRRELLAFGMALFVAPFVAVMYELVQVTGNDPLPWASAITRERPFGTLGNAGPFAQYLGTLGPAALTLSFWAPLGVGRATRLFLLVAGIAALGGAILTNTRALLLGLGLVGLVVGGRLLFRAPSPRARLLAIGAFAAVVVVGVVVGRGQVARAVDAVMALAPGLTEGRAVEVGSVGGRTVLYRVATEIVGDRPILGVGPDNYVAAFSLYRPPEATTAFATTVTQTSTHSWVLYLATSVGLLGLLVFGLLLGFAAWRSIKDPDPIRFAALVGLISFLGTGLVSTNDVGTEWLPWTALGLIALRLQGETHVQRSTRTARRKQAPPDSQNTPRLVVIASLVTAVALSVGVFQSRAWGAARDAEAARSARHRGDGVAATQAAQRATDQDPIRAEYWNALGLGLTKTGRFDRAVISFGRAADLAPYEPSYLANLARGYVAIGTSQASARPLALEAARKAVSKGPNVPDLYNTLSLALFANGQTAEAVRAAEEALARGATRPDGLVAEYVGRYYASVGQLSDADTWLRRARSNLPGRAGFDAGLLLAQVSLLQGKRAEALAAVEAILAIDPTYEPALRLKAELLAQ